MRAERHEHDAVRALIARSAMESPQRRALVCDDRALSYAELLLAIDALASLFSACGLARGGRAAVCTRDKMTGLLAILGAGAAGAVAVPLTEGSPMRALESTIAHAAPAFLVMTAADLQEYPQFRSSPPCPLLVLRGTDAADPTSWHFLLGPVSAQHAPPPEGASLLLYAPGPNGERRGALLSGSSLVATASAAISMCGIDGSTCEFVMAPLHRSFALTRCRAVLFAGGTLLLSSGPLHPATVVHAVLRHHVNALSFFPSTFESLFAHQESLVRRIAPQIRHVELGSAPMLPAQKERYLELFPRARLTMPYGLTEAPRSACLAFGSERTKLATVGRATPYAEIAISDAGEVLLRGPHVMLGYWRDDSGAPAPGPDGWFHTGDVGALDADGYLALSGRSDDLITTDGATFSPREIEDLIREFFPAYEFCIVGIPDPAGILGEIPVLCYTPRHGKTITPSELARLLADRVDHTKIPHIVYRVEPSQLSGGRLRRDEVRTRLLQTFAHAANS